MILMQVHSNIEYLVGDASTASTIERVLPLIPFSEEAGKFLASFSRYIMDDERARAYPDVTTLAFWCRPASFRQMEKSYEGLGNRLGRGIVFHIAPSNVAVNFAYSCIAAFLAGNASIVRLPSKDFPQISLICQALEKALEDFPMIRPYFLFVRYGHVQDWNDYFSALCQTRVIWGGNQTIESLRQSPLAPRANEITFADRHSMAVIDADAYLASEEKEEIARNFYNDTYLTDQNACSAPFVIVWLGKEIQTAQNVFWDGLHDFVEERYDLQAVQSVDKWTNLCLMGAEFGGHLIPMQDNLITRVHVTNLTEKLLAYKLGSGFFVEYVAVELGEMKPLCTSSCQTIAYYGIDPKEISHAILSMRPQGVDRIVPIGQTLHFSLVWDGVDLIRAMSREITVM